MELRIGTRITLEVVSDEEHNGGCGACWFKDLESCPSELDCLGSSRTDGKNVHYKAIEIKKKEE